MEITAALEAVTLSVSPGPIEVVSDSTYVVNCFRDKWWEVAEARVAEQPAQARRQPRPVGAARRARAGTRRRHVPLGQGPQWRPDERSGRPPCRRGRAHPDGPHRRPRIIRAVGPPSVGLDSARLGRSRADGNRPRYVPRCASVSTRAEPSPTPSLRTEPSSRCCRRRTTRRAAVRDAVEALGESAARRVGEAGGARPRHDRGHERAARAKGRRPSRSSRTRASPTSSRSRRQDRPSLYDPFADRPQPLVERRHRFEVGGRLGLDGDELEPVDLTGLLPLPDEVEAVAVCLLHSDLSARHETTVATALVAARLRRHRVERRLTRVPRVRAHGDDRRQRLPAPAVSRLPVAPVGSRRRRARAHVGRRARAGRRCGRRACSLVAVRSGRRRAGGGGRGGRERVRRRDHLRHGRHVDRRLPRARRGAGARARPTRRGLPDPAAVARRAHHRCRRRLDRTHRRGRRARGRSGERRRDAGARVLRARRRRTDRHRRRPRARTHPRGSSRFPGSACSTSTRLGVGARRAPASIPKASSPWSTPRWSRRCAA